MPARLSAVENESSPHFPSRGANEEEDVEILTEIGGLGKFLKNPRPNSSFLDTFYADVMGRLCSRLRAFRNSGRAGLGELNVHPRTGGVRRFKDMSSGRWFHHPFAQFYWARKCLARRNKTENGLPFQLGLDGLVWEKYGFAKGFIDGRREGDDGFGFDRFGFRLGPAHPGSDHRRCPL